MRPPVYKKTKVHAAEVLETAASVLTRWGRPRKLPGKDRESNGGSFTLPDALAVAARAHHATRTAKRYAIDVVEAQYGLPLDIIDNEIADTRKIVRLLNSTAKTLVTA